MATFSPAIAALLRGAGPVGGGDALIPLHFSGKREEIASSPPDMNRKIAAILAADVAGYSRLVAADEEGALRRLVEAQAVFKDRVAAYRGRIFNTAGDAILAEFPSAVDATRAALDIQRAIADRNTSVAANDRFLFRIGLNIGDVVEHEGDLLGDGVNVAARLQTLAPAGGLAISHWVREHTAGKITLPFRDIGKQSLKNIPSPIQVFVADLAPAVVKAASPDAAAATSPVTPQLKLAIAAALLLALGVAAFTQFRNPAPSSAALPSTETATPPATPPPVVEPAKAAITAPAQPAPRPLTKQPEATKPPAAAATPPSPQPIVPRPAAAPAAPAIEAARPPSLPAEKAVVLPPPVAAQPAPGTPAKVEKETAPAKRPQMTCAEVLERAQLGDITADDRAFLRNQCR